MRADLRMEMGRYGNACLQRRRSPPTSEIPLRRRCEIGHDEIAGFLLQRDANVARAVEL
jgi:hypothetical protein